MGKLKSALEIAMEKAEKLDRLSSEEIQKIKEEEKIKTLLSKFYLGKIRTNDLWEKLQGSSPSLLKNAQIILINSLNFNNNPHELKLRKEGILALESLKKNNNISILENLLTQLNSLKNEFVKNIKYMEEKAKAELEKDPQSRLKTIRQGDKLIVMQLSVEEALQQNSHWKDFLHQQEEKYYQQFERLREKIKQTLEQSD
ncbi:MAG: hypothetical protein Kow00103_06230 [Candidatus Caldatribacteriota bacterium]